MKTKLKKGQTVQLITGVDKGKSGEIIKLFPRDYKALIKGINIKKKHQKPTKEKKGGIVNLEKPVHLSNLKVLGEKKVSEKSKAVNIEKKLEQKKTTISKPKKTQTKKQTKKTKKKVTK